MKHRLPLTGNVCDRRLWRIKGASVGAAVDFVGHRKRAIAVERSETEGEKAINIKLSLSLPQSFFKRKMTAPFTREPESDRGKPCPYGSINY